MGGEKTITFMNGGKHSRDLIGMNTEKKLRNAVKLLSVVPAESARDGAAG
jgi:hypothetical protein